MNGGTDLSAETQPIKHHETRIEFGWQPGIAGTLIAMQARYYARHHGFGHVFEASISSAIGVFLARYNPARDRLFHAWSGARCLGGLAIDGTTPQDDADAKLRWFIVAEEAHGQGVGGRLLEDAMAFCRETGLGRVMLDTFKGLDAARALYQRHGFVLIGESQTARWGPEVLEQVYLRETAMA